MVKGRWRDEEAKVLSKERPLEQISHLQCNAHLNQHRMVAVAR